MMETILCYIDRYKTMHINYVQILENNPDMNVNLQNALTYYCTYFTVNII